MTGSEVSELFNQITLLLCLLLQHIVECHLPHPFLLYSTLPEASPIDPMHGSGCCEWQESYNPEASEYLPGISDIVTILNDEGTFQASVVIESFRPF